MATIWDSPAFTPSASSGGPFFQPGNTYGADSSWSDTAIGEMIREQNPELAFAQYGNRLGIGDTDNSFNRWFYQQFPRFQRGYGLATIQNPTLKIDDFLATLPGMQALQQQYNLSSPAARGMSYSTYTPSVRWISG